MKKKKKGTSTITGKIKKKGNGPTNLCGLCESNHADKRCSACQKTWYCSKECQELHWKKGGHKQECGELIQSAAEQARSDRSVNATNRAGEKKSDEQSDRAGTLMCAICLGPPERPVKLPCSHEFCGICVDALRSRGLKQLCPLCRKPLPPGAEKLREQADRLIIQVERHVNREEFSWSTLPPTFRRKMKNVEILYQESAAQGDAFAQHNLGVMYMKGHGVSQNHARALEWWRKAANQGFAGAQINLGVMYANGEGVLQDHVRAVEWYRKAANQGDADAQCNLGVMYENGDGVLQDHVQAVKWWSKAANQGHARAQSVLDTPLFEK